MIEELSISVSPEIAFDPEKLKKKVASQTGEKLSEINDIRIVRKSIDSRQKNIKVNLKLRIAKGEDHSAEIEPEIKKFEKVPQNASVLIIVGAGPAGLFAGLKAIESGIKPIIVERGENVESRRVRLAEISRLQKIDPDTNYCFGEGGAGAYSDGKLYTRSKKKGNNSEILNLLCQFGADKNILTENHPHIGSDKLPSIIRNIRETIISKGGEIRFQERMTDILIENKTAVGIKTNKNEEIKGGVLLATGHSAKDIYHILNDKGIALEPKGFAVGVRLEHPQDLIDRLQYHTQEGRGAYLPPAEYSFLSRVDGRAVYSFCMCPGGVIVPSMSAEKESLVNGMSASQRSGRRANSAIVVEIKPEDIEGEKNDPLKLLKFQEKLEKQFYELADQTLKAPAQRMTDFIEGIQSATLPTSSYPAGIISKRVDEALPPGISERLKKGFLDFNNKCRGFLTEEATVVGLESRTSSPVRIPRDPVTLEHIEIKNLYPCGEGAGYSGGIVSSAIDGQRCVEAFAGKIKK